MSEISKKWTEILRKYQKNIYESRKDKRIEEWNKIISSLPKLYSSKAKLHEEVLVSGKWDSQEKIIARDLLLKLAPWRKGPFKVGDIFIDSEWRSHWKWKRFLGLNINLSGKTILDVGSGNGYYGFRMLGHGAEFVMCLEPNLLYLTQFKAINHFIQSNNIAMIPERIEELTFSDKCFDLIFSMGVLYHQRDPEKHMEKLRSHLKDSGRIILETLIVPEQYGEGLKTEGNYANMPNVRLVQTKKGLENLARKTNLNILSISVPCQTTTREQRSTDWMPFRSLSKALNTQLTKTIEGFPRPERVFLILKK